MASPEEPRPDELSDRIVSNYLVQLGLTFAVVVTIAAVWLIVYAYSAFCFLANS